MKDGWATRALADVCEFQRGLTYSKCDEVDFSSNIVVRANNVDLANNQLDLSELKYINDQIQIPFSKVLKQGSLLICTASGSKSHLGKVAFIDKDYGYAFGGFMGQITPLPSILPRFLFYALTSESYKRFISALSDGANINNLRFDDLARFQVPVPPLPEQQQIAALLDDAFAGLATVKTNAEQNLQNANILLESYLEVIFSTAREGWGEEQLGDLCEIARGGSPRPISDFITSDDNGVNWVKISDASASNKYIFKTGQKIKPEGVARSRMVHDGDFLLSNSMSFGRPYIMRTSGCIHDGWLVLSNYQDRLCQDYLYHLLGSAAVYRQFDSLAAGSTVRNLNIELASRVAIPVPHLDLQQDIASKIEILGTEIKHLTSVYERKLTALEELKTSLLHQAFSGEL